jgi:FtsP/CotA-like multicopper oxidase with cupredoxin domain
MAFVRFRDEPHLKLVADPFAPRPATPALPFWQLGTEGGFLPAPVMLESLLMGLAERADVIVDFTGLPVGTELYLINEGPDEPFGGGTPGTDFGAADPQTTGQVMKFVVVPLTGQDTSLDPARLTLPAFKPLGPATNTPPGLPQRAGEHVPALRRPGRRPARDAGRGRHPGREAVGGSDHGEPGPERDRGLGDLQLHRGRPSHPHPRGAVPGGRSSARRG